MKNISLSNPLELIMSSAVLWEPNILLPASLRCRGEAEAFEPLLRRWDTPKASSPVPPPEMVSPTRTKQDTLSGSNSKQLNQPIGE